MSIILRTGRYESQCQFRSSTKLLFLGHFLLSSPGYKPFKFRFRTQTFRDFGISDGFKGCRERSSRSCMFISEVPPPSSQGVPSWVANPAYRRNYWARQKLYKVLRSWFCFSEYFKRRIETKKFSEFWVGITLVWIQGLFKMTGLSSGRSCSR